MFFTAKKKKMGIGFLSLFPEEVHSEGVHALEIFVGKKLEFFFSCMLRLNSVFFSNGKKKNCHAKLQLFHQTLSLLHSTFFYLNNSVLQGKQKKYEQNEKERKN